MFHSEDIGRWSCR